MPPSATLRLERWDGWKLTWQSNNVMILSFDLFEEETDQACVRVNWRSGQGIRHKGHKVFLRPQHLGSLGKTG